MLVNLAQEAHESLPSMLLGYLRPRRDLCKLAVHTLAKLAGARRGKSVLEVPGAGERVVGNCWGKGL